MGSDGPSDFDWAASMDGLLHPIGGGVTEEEETGGVEADAVLVSLTLVRMRDEDV